MQLIMIDDQPGIRANNLSQQHGDHQERQEYNPFPVHQIHPFMVTSREKRRIQ